MFDGVCYGSVLIYTYMGLVELETIKSGILMNTTQIQAFESEEEVESSTHE